MSSTALFLRLLSSLTIAGLAGSGDLSTLRVYAPPGAVVSASHSDFSCGPKAVCDFQVQIPFETTFSTRALEGYEFYGWTDDSYSSCSNEKSNCQLSLAYKDLLANPLSVGSAFKFQPVLVADDSARRSAWSYPARDRFLGEQLEKNIDYCSTATIRWDAPITNFDVNLDGIDDLLLHISCYQGLQPEDPEQPHNLKVIAAWKMFCSEASLERHHDCTEKLFGQTVINATGSDSGGGNPYTHVINKPRDLNGDGYPEFWYALNRDDGRPGIPNENREEYDQWLAKLCGLEAQNGCTRSSNQSMLISRPDGSYQVAITPVPPTNTQAAEIFPNLLGTFDLAMFNYGPMTAARWTGSEFIDVTEEWRAYENVQYAFQDQYVHAFTDDATGSVYLVVPNVPESIVGSPRPDKAIARQPDRHLGFVLWRFIPGFGFQLSDYYVAPEEDLFTAKVMEGGNDQYTIQEGVYINGIPTLLPNYFHMKVTRLTPDGDLVLFMQQENDGGTTFGEFLKSPIDSDVIYRFPDGAISDEQGYLTHRVTPTQTFYIREGRLFETTEPLISGGYLWNTPGMRFSDIDGDGDKDLLGISGGSPRGSIHINDGSGKMTMKAVKDVLPEIWFHDSEQSLNYSVFPLKLDFDNKPDLVFWENGFNQRIDPIGAGDVVILRGEWSISDFRDLSPNDINNAIVGCHKRGEWIGGCEIF